MPTRRDFVAAGIALIPAGALAKFDDQDGSRTARLLRDVRIEERAVTGNLNGNGTPERMVRVSFVPTRQLLGVRLEQWSEDATEPEAAADLDENGDGWYVIARQVGIGQEQLHTRHVLRAPPSRRLSSSDDRWLVEGRGYAPGRTAETDIRGFTSGDRLRVVAMRYDGDPVVVHEYVVAMG